MPSPATAVDKVFVSNKIHRDRSITPVMHLAKWGALCLRAMPRDVGFHQCHIRIYTVHRSRVDPRKEFESCGNARFRERK
jgi:hypothetical protein